LGLTNVTVAAPDEVPDDVVFDVIWSNPPIKVGKQELHDLLNRWLARLSPDGYAVLVVNKNLGSDSLANWLTELGWTVKRISSRQGFRVLTVKR
jgi:16S rRNA G1207 methylase RsmC